MTCNPTLAAAIGKVSLVVRGYNTEVHALYNKMAWQECSLLPYLCKATLYMYTSILPISLFEPFVNIPDIAHCSVGFQDMT